MTEPDELRERVAQWLADAERVTVLTGAGVSTDSGIPDYRGPQGVWTKNPGAERKSTIETWLTDREHRVESWQRRAGSEGLYDARPNDAHRALTRLADRGQLEALVTQNIDGLHQRAGTPDELVVEVHGTMHAVSCLECGERAPVEIVLERVRGGDEDPHCRTCHGLLKSATISFGQSLVPDDLERASAAARRCEVFLAVGTSLTVYPVAQLPLLATRTGAKLAIVNAEPTPLDTEADAVLLGPVADILPALLPA